MIRRITYLGCLCAIALTATAPEPRASSRDTSGADNQVIPRWLASFSASLNQGDLAAFETLWTDDADWAPPDAPMLRGRQAILDHARVAFDRYRIHHTFTAQSFKAVDDFAVALITSVERYTPKASAGAAWEQGTKGVVVLRRSADGSWTAVHFIWNRDAAPPPGAILVPAAPR